MLAKKNTGMNATIVKNSTTFSTVNARFSEDVDADERVLRAQLDEREHDEQREPAHDARPRRDGVPAPLARLLEAEHAEPHAAHDQHQPGQSIGAGCRSSTIFARATRKSATTATGTLIQKMARHVHSLR